MAAAIPTLARAQSGRHLRRYILIALAASGLVLLSTLLLWVDAPPGRWRSFALSVEQPSKGMRVQAFGEVATATSEFLDAESMGADERVALLESTVRRSLGWPLTIAVVEYRREVIVAATSRRERERGLAAWLEGDEPTELKISVSWSSLALATLVVAGAWVCAAYTIALITGVLRARRGRCPQCGYDRTGIDARPCPECGTPQRVAPH